MVISNIGNAHRSNMVLMAFNGQSKSFCSGFPAPVY